MKTYLFDDKRSLGHAVFGFISAIVPFWLGIIIIISYTIYEVKEPENAVSTVGDLMEFVVGFMLGIMIRLGI